MRSGLERAPRIRSARRRRPSRILREVRARSAQRGSALVAAPPRQMLLRPGSVALVGAGPGDPELLTIRGTRFLAEADVIVHDRLVSAALLDLAPPRVVRCDVGKQGFGPSTSQAWINELLIGLARAGRRVIRLKGGDPFVFGRGGEEASALRAAGIPFVVVPGISAGIGGPAYAGIPVTDRRHSRSVAFVTGHDPEEQRDGAVDWAGLRGAETLVVFMAGRRRASVARRLLEAGWPHHTPAAVLTAATLPTQRVERSTLEAMGRWREGPTDRGLPALLVIGRSVELADDLDWFSPLLSAAVGASDPAAAELADPVLPGRREPLSVRWHNIPASDQVIA